MKDSVSKDKDTLFLCLLSCGLMPKEVCELAFGEFCL